MSSHRLSQCLRQCCDKQETCSSAKAERVNHEGGAVRMKKAESAVGGDSQQHGEDNVGPNPVATHHAERNGREGDNHLRGIGEPGM